MARLKLSSLRDGDQKEQNLSNTPTISMEVDFRWPEPRELPTLTSQKSDEGYQNRVMCLLISARPGKGTKGLGPISMESRWSAQNTGGKATRSSGPEARDRNSDSRLQKTTSLG